MRRSTRTGPCGRRPWVSRTAATVGALTLATMIGAVGTANAASDSYTVNHVEIGAFNNNSDAGGQFGFICNYQSSRTDFWFWVKDDNTGGLTNLQDSNGRWYWASKLDVWVDPGTCEAFKIGGAHGHTVQAYFSSNGTYGTNPIPFG